MDERDGDRGVEMPDDAGDGLEMLARVGYAARGVLYITVGLLAAGLAFGWGGATTGSRGAMRAIAAQPLGQVALAVIAIGLAGYAVWRAIDAVKNPAHFGHDVKGVATRIGYAIRAVANGALAWAAFSLALHGGAGSGSGSGGQQTEHWTARILHLPGGRWLVGLTGAGIILYGLSRLYKAWKADIGRQMRVGEMTRDAGRWVVHVSRFGIAARGVVFGMIGWLLIRAAVQYDPQEAGGIGDALAELSRHGYGTVLLLIVTLGLVAFGVYSGLEAKYRRIDVA